MSSNKTSLARRRFLGKAAIGVPATALLEGSKGLVQNAIAAESDPSSYRPTFFNDHEWEFLKAATDRLIPPSSDGPSAVEAGVPEFLDRQMQTAYGHGGLWYMNGPFFPESVPTLGYQLKLAPRDLYRVAIAAVDNWCTQNRGNAFAQLSDAQRDEVLTLMQKDQLPLRELPVRVFFAQLLQNTKEGYFADPIHGGNRGMGAWKMIGFPGARADFVDMSAQPGKVYPLGPVSISGKRG